MPKMMKRFYSLFSKQKQPQTQGYSILLDGKAVKTPAKNNFTCPNAELADAIVVEWSNQSEHIDPENMPLTQFVSTAQDRVCGQEEQLRDEILNYLESDLLYFRTDTQPGLNAYQDKAWMPCYSYTQSKVGTLPKMRLTFDIFPLDNTTKQNYMAFLESLDLLGLTVMTHLTTSSGSAVLAYAFYHGEINVEEFVQAAFCEELFYIELYKTQNNGLDPSLKKKMESFKRDAIACQTILQPMHKDR